MSTVVRHGLTHLFAEFLQYLIPVGLLIGAIGGYFKQRRASALFVATCANPKPTISAMSWRDFERLVGEAFRRRGFKVTGFAGNGPDGGVDLGLSKDGKRFLVQCKHWKRKQVDVTVVRELYGVISAQRAHGGYVVTGGEFTRDAREFANSCGVELIDGHALEEMISHVPSDISGSTSEPSTLRDAPPLCPRCGEGMLQRTAKRGKFAGQPFWGCARYPQCTEILRIS